MRKVPLSRGNIYHIYNRGVDHADIFFSRENHLFFLRRLRVYCSPAEGEVLAYCLMPNHYHLLIRVLSDDFSHAAMQPLTVSYTKAINKQEGRSGPLFQGAFHARLVSGIGDLVQLSRYIHLNPVMAHLAVHPAAWEFSSYPDYVGLRHGTLPCPQLILSHFTSPAAYAEYVERTLDPRGHLTKEMMID